MGVQKYVKNNNDVLIKTTGGSCNGYFLRFVNRDDSGKITNHGIELNELLKLVVKHFHNREMSNHEKNAISKLEEALAILNQTGK